MAKQNVTFIERHLEKFVIGICGAILLGVVVLFLIDTPNKVEVDGQSLAAREFYRYVEEQANQVVTRMKNAQPETGQPPEGVTNPNLAQTPSPLIEGKLPPEISTVFVSPSPAIPVMPDLDEKPKVELAEIVAPVKPVLTTGRSSGKLPEPEEVEIVSDRDKPPSKSGDSLELTRDYFWATVVTAINRKEQRELFEQAGYNSSRLALVVASVEAEREELLPNGQWRNPAIVRSYAPMIYIPATNVKTVEQDGEIIVPPDQMSLIEAHHQKFGTDAQQADVLRPHFVDFLDEQWRWSVKELPGVELDWEEFGIELPDEEEEKASRRTSLRDDSEKPGRPGAAADDNSENREIVDTMKKAEKAIAEKKYLEAEELLLSVKARGESSPVHSAKAEKILEELAGEIEEARVAEEQKQRLKEQWAKFNFGPDIDPVWINDITVTPGKVYRYRVRVVALNQYAGLPAELKDSDDATKLVRYGKWSEWSDPIVVKPDKQLFLTGVDGDIAKIEIHQWANGKWKSATTARLTLGQPITLGSGRSATTHGIIVDIDPRRRYANQKEAEETPALVLVNSRGEVEEHLVIEDQIRKKEFMTEKREEDLERPAAQQQPRLRQPAPRPGRPMGRQPQRNAERQQQGS